MSDAAGKSPGKKRKAAGAGAAASKLQKGIGSLLARLEATNASFLQQSAADSLQQQVKASLARAKADALEAAARPATSPSLASLPVDHQELARRAERRQRFQEEKAAAAAAAGIRDRDKTLVELRSEQGVARGQNQSLEKDYLRLTSLPSAADVRPPEVLAQALELVKQRWSQGCEYGGPRGACDQLKSIRQDLTVQHIRSRFTVQVYETHGRIAIEVADWAEFRQCHSVLQSLYAEGLPGEQHEFCAYGLLLAAATGRSGLSHELADALRQAGSGLREGMHGSGGGGGGGSWGAAGRSPGEAGGSGSGSGAAAAAAQGGHEHADGATAGAAAVADDRYVPHALACCRAYLEGNVVRFLRLYEGAPRMAPYLMDALLAKMRGQAYSTVLAAFQPSMPLAALSGWFGFSKKKEAAAFLRERGAVVKEGSLAINESRAAAARLAAAAAQQQQQDAARR